MYAADLMWLVTALKELKREKAPCIPLQFLELAEVIETGIVETFRSPELQAAWRAPVNAGFAGPAVSAGRVFVTDFKTSAGMRGTERALAFALRRLDALPVLLELERHTEQRSCARQRQPEGIVPPGGTILWERGERQNESSSL